MALTNTTADDWLNWVEMEDVTLRVRSALAPAYTIVSVTAANGGAGGAKRRAIRRADVIASNGVYTGDNQVWYIPKQNCPAGGSSVQPRPGHIILDGDNVSHTVLEVQIGKYGQTFRCITLALEIVNGLSALGTLSRSTLAKDGASRRTFASYTDVATNVKCRVQPVDSNSRQLFDRITNPGEYVAFVGQALDVQANDRFTVATIPYTVLGCKNPERLDQLLALSLERIP